MESKQFEKFILEKGTSEYEKVDGDEFITAYIKGSFLKDYNTTSIKEYDNYLTISSPSPKTDYCGFHKTLILKKYPTDELANDTLLELIDNAIISALEFGKKLGYKNAVDKIKEITNIDG